MPVANILTADLKKVHEIEEDQPYYREGIREYMEKNLGVISGLDYKILVSTHNLIAHEETATVYGDHISGKAFKVDFKKQEIVALEDLPPIEDDNIKDTVRLLGLSLKTYLQEFFAATNQLLGRLVTKSSLLQRSQNSYRLHFKDSEL